MEGRTMYFPRQFIDSLKQSIPLEQLIGQSIELKQHGDHFVGLCPFHDDHNPSFTVFPQTQSFYCFGCHAGAKTVTTSSDHIAFLVHYHKLPFPKAVELLAEITQPPLPQQQSPTNASATSQQTNHQTQQSQPSAAETADPSLPQLSKDPICQQIFNLTAQFYHQQLFQPDAQFALDYLIHQRGRNLDTINNFHIGFAKGGRALYQFLKSKGCSDDQLLKSNLIAKRNNCILDYFFGSILIFPHFKNDNVIGFTIKDLGHYRSPIKLRLFSRNTFYNHNSLNAQNQQIILVEGESDLHSIVQFTDRKNVLALCGNQLTQVQRQHLVKANITIVYLALDRDAAGKKATQKISQQLIDAGMTVCPLQWSCHKDIDLWLRFMPPDQRQASFEQLIAQAKQISSARKATAVKSNQTDQQPQPNQQPAQPSHLQLIKELLKAVAILLTTILMLLKNSKTYVHHRKNPSHTKPTHYHQRPTFSIDQLPVYQPKKNIPHYTILLNEHQQTHGKPLTPVKRKTGKRKPPHQARCGWCEAPAQYLSLNDGKKQVYCKVCKQYSNFEKQIKDVTITCPHCNKTLEKMVKHTEKNGYLYFKCRNKKCTYFISNKNRLKNLSTKQKKKFKKLHYIYRKPIIDITRLHPNSPDKPKVDLAQVRSSAYVIGLIMTYRAMGQSTRTIASLMEEVHEVAISHQTVKNYLDAAAYRLAPLVMNYPYDLSGILAADETYIRVIGNWNYLTWSFDPKAQIIAALNISEKRNLIALAKAINHAVSKFSLDLLTEPADFNPLLVTDGNPVYPLIVQFLRQANIFINHKIVIGLENNDDQSTDFRNLKQIIERLNKNFKKYINNSEYFGSTNGLLSAAVMFAAHFNFIRKNSVLHGNIPVPIDTIDIHDNQPCRWIRLLDYAQVFCQQQQ
jgi:putative transposase